jgi:hypothetical protein
MKQKLYPDIADVLGKKARGRIERAFLSFAEKLAIVDKLRENVSPIVRSREARTRISEENPADSREASQR